MPRVKSYPSVSEYPSYPSEESDCWTDKTDIANKDLLENIFIDHYLKNGWFEWIQNLYGHKLRIVAWSYKKYREQQFANFSASVKFRISLYIMGAVGPTNYFGKSSHIVEKSVGTGERLKICVVHWDVYNTAKIL